MDGLRRCGFEGAQIETFELSQCLQHRNPAGTGRSRPADRVIAVFATHCRADFRSVFGQILHAQITRIARVRVHFVHDGLSNRTGIQRFRTVLGDGLEHCRVFRVL